MIGVTLLPLGLSTVICRSMNLSSSFCVLTRSNWKFCSSTRVAGSVSEVNVTVVGSMSAATSVNESCERPCLIFMLAVIAHQRVSRHGHRVGHALSGDRPVELGRYRARLRGAVDRDGGFGDARRPRTQADDTAMASGRSGFPHGASNLGGKGMETNGCAAAGGAKPSRRDKLRTVSQVRWEPLSGM